MNPFLSTLILLAGLTGASGGVASQQSDYPVPTSRTTLAIPQQASQPQVATSTVITSGDSLYGEPFLPSQAQENVLVVPTPDLPAESMADLAEDLTVMCRIFDKSFSPPRSGTDGMYGDVSGLYGDRGSGFRFVIGQQARGTQGLYLDGYGALFFVHVDYPLAPVEPQEQSQAKPKESADAVWSQTIQEMTGRPGDEQQTARNTPTYDPQKVENLRKTLIKTLAHAANIRMRRPQDAITLVVGTLDDTKAAAYGRYRSAGRSTSAISPVRPRVTQPPSAIRNPTAALLILRVTKADVDAFAKRQMMLGEFTQKVQILLSPSGPGAPPTPATAPTPVSSPR